MKFLSNCWSKKVNEIRELTSSEIDQVNGGVAPIVIVVVHVVVRTAASSAAREIGKAAVAGAAGALATIGAQKAMGD